VEGGIQINIRMHGTIPEIVSHAHKQQLDLLSRPSQAPRQERHTHGMHAIEQILLGPHTDQLLLLAAGPRVQRPVEVLLDDVDEARGVHVAAVVLGVRYWASEILGREADLRAPFLQCVTIHRAVDAADWHLRVLELEEAAGPERVVCLLDDPGGVFEAGEQGAAVDVVELLTVVPGFFGVAYFEAAVWGDAGDC